MILFITLLEKEIIMKGLFLERIDKSGLLIIFISFLTVLFTLSLVQAQELKTIKLPEVNKNRGSSLMEALSKKASAQNWSDKDLSMQDLSDLLWAAAGINRPDSKKRTYSSAMNTQDVDVYVFMKDGVYIYDYENHALKPVISGDHRADIAGSFSMSGGGMPSGGPSGGAPGAALSGGQGSAPAGAGQPGGAPGGATTAGAPSAGAGRETSSANFPVDLLLVSDPSKYRAGADDLKKEWGAFSAGIITQNVMLFCSANDLGTRPRAMFDKAKLRTLLKLKDNQNPVIELPVGYLK
jgi:nitroreductase